MHVQHSHIPRLHWCQQTQTVGSREPNAVFSCLLMEPMMSSSAISLSPDIHQEPPLSLVLLVSWVQIPCAPRIEPECILIVAVKSISIGEHCQLGQVLIV